MIKTTLYSLVLLLAIVQPVWGQDLVPATSEDLQEFDRAVSKLKGAAKPADKPANFGSQVKEEAKKLKDATADERNSFGKWVSGQRKKSAEGRPSAEGSFGGGGSNANGKRVQPDPSDKNKGKRGNSGR